MPNVTDNEGLSVLHSACKCPIDNTDNIKHLLKKSDCDGNFLFNGNAQGTNFIYSSCHYQKWRYSTSFVYS